MATIYDGQPLAAKIARLEAELAAAKQQQRDALVVAIAATIPPGVVFSSADLWQHQAVQPELRAALEDAGIQSPKQLGRRLQRLCSCGLVRVGEDRAGVLWTVEVCDDSHRNP